MRRLAKPKMSAVSLNAVEELSDEDRRALRASRFGGSNSYQPLKKKETEVKRIAHPGGAIVSNKAGALARFLKRKLQDPTGFAALDPELVERAVKAAKTEQSANAPSKSSPSERDNKDAAESSASEDDVHVNARKKGKHAKSKKGKPLLSAGGQKSSTSYGIVKSRKKLWKRTKANNHGD